MQKFLLIICVCLLGGITCWKSIASDSVADDLLLKNVEALAEWESELPTFCRFSGNYTCPIHGEQVGEVYEGYSLRTDEETY